MNEALKRFKHLPPGGAMIGLTGRGQGYINIIKTNVTDSNH